MMAHCRPVVRYAWLDLGTGNVNYVFAVTIAYNLALVCVNRLQLNES